MSTSIYSIVGLTQNEIKIYEALLQKGEYVISKLANDIGMDKSSAYKACEGLFRKKLLIKNSLKRGSTYIAVNPDFIKDLFDEKKSALKEQETNINLFIKTLKQKAKQIPHTSNIRIEYGYEAHKRALLRILDSKEKVVRLKTNTDAPVYKNRGYIDFMRKVFVPERLKRKIFYKQMFQYKQSYPLNDLNITSKKNMKEVRILPQDFSTVDSFKMYDDYVDITIYEKDKDETCISIKDKSIAALMKELFDYIWNRSIVYYGSSKIPTLSLKDGTKLPKICMGTRGIASWDSIGNVYMEKNPYTQTSFTQDALSHFLSYGVNYIDLCHKYAGGEATRVVSSLIRNYPRNKLLLSGKFTRIDDKIVANKREVEKQCDNYLKILNTDYLDFYQIHSPRVMSFSIRDAVIEIEKLIAKGKVRRLSISNFEVSHLKEALNVSKYGVSLNEVPYNLFDNSYLKNGTIEFCKRKSIPLLFYRPLALGRLCGFEYDLDAPELIKYLTKKYKKTSAQIALNWLLQKKNSAVLLKSENPANIRENIASFDFKMTNKDYKKLDDFSKAYDKS